MKTKLQDLKRPNAPDLKLLEGIRKFIRDHNFNVALTLQRNLPFTRSNVLDQDYIWNDARRFAGEMNFTLLGPLWRELPLHKTIHGVVTMEKINTSPHFHFALCVPTDVLATFTDFVEGVWQSIRPSGSSEIKRSSRSQRAGWANYITKEGEYGSLDGKWLTYADLLDRLSQDSSKWHANRAVPSFTGFYSRMSARPCEISVRDHASVPRS